MNTIGTYLYYISYFYGTKRVTPCLKDWRLKKIKNYERKEERKEISQKNSQIKNIEYIS